MEPPKPDSEAPHARAALLQLAVHEINNPLESVLNLLYLAESDPGISQDTRNHLKLAQAEVMRVARIAQAAMKRLPIPGSAEQTDLAALLGSVLELHKPRLDRRNVSASTRHGPDATAVVYPERMRQVFSNLILNAIDAMPAGGKLYARASRKREWSGTGREGLRITIADTGMGILPENLSRIREPFFTTKGANGNGMGLAVVQEIVEQHSGVLKVRSSVRAGKSGTVLSIFLPTAKAPAT